LHQKRKKLEEKALEKHVAQVAAGAKAADQCVTHWSAAFVCPCGNLNDMLSRLSGADEGGQGEV